jgi:sterol desaturase/sphingolipid hydroxylase (fatty acid hydroxylase superfamily)
MNIEKFVADDLLYIMMIGALGALLVAERVWPAMPRPPRSGRRTLDNLLVGALYLVVAAVPGAVVTAIAAYAAQAHLGLFRMWAPPFWVQMVLGIVAIDFVEYWRHRFSHTVPWIWTIHRLHHTDPFMDVSTTLRNHPFHWIVIVPRAVLIPLLGLSPLTLAVHASLAILVQYFHHSNVRVPAKLEAVLNKIIVTPDMHFVHHGCARKHNDSQYAIILILWDRLFRTLAVPAPDRKTLELGLDGFKGAYEQTVAGMMVSPFGDRQRRRWLGVAVPEVGPGLAADPLPARE